MKKNINLGSKFSLVCLSFAIFLGLQNTTHAAISGHLDITSPNGGETYTEGDVVNITWDASDNIDKLSLGYSRGEGNLNWIETSVPNTGSYSWTVDVGNTSNTQFVIDITGYETGEGSLSDRSDNYFTVFQEGEMGNGSQSTQSGPNSSVAKLNRFPDVSKGETFFEYIEMLASEGVVGGYSSGNFGMNDNVERQQLAKFIRKGFEIPTDISCEKFPDVNSTNIFFEDIMSLKCAGIISGYKDGTFKPTKSVSRAETMSFIIKAARYKENDTSFLPASKDNEFSDLSNENVHIQNILAGYSNNIVSGDKGKFMPDMPVSRGAVSKMITNTRIKLNLSTQQGVDFFRNLKKYDFRIVETSDYVFYYPSNYVFGKQDSETLLYSNPNTNNTGGQNVATISKLPISGLTEEVTLSDCNEIADGIATEIDATNTKILESKVISNSTHQRCFISVTGNIEGGQLVIDTMVSYKVNETGLYTNMISYSVGSPVSEIEQLELARDLVLVK